MRDPDLRDGDLDLLAELEENPAAERIAAALALLHPVAAVTDLRTHFDGCHHTHAGCLARLAIAALTGEDTT